ncbi:hypothetical protein IHE44_0004849 [Lamprotornis superbus]|uniref:Uncharacterized protein n=1 Tax=Lamprotornis superbus TaxID=245042 RepID=A0A835ND27_9PASS|nr:hypothetical protein IHE44_0004849 [Lamprotornis superbus]
MEMDASFSKKLHLADDTRVIPLLATTCIPVTSPSPGTAPSPPQPCHQQHVPFAFDIILHINHPRQAVTTAPHILQHLLYILQHVLYILSSPSTPQHWDTQACSYLFQSGACANRETGMTTVRLGPGCDTAHALEKIAVM